MDKKAGALLVIYIYIKSRDVTEMIITKITAGVIDPEAQKFNTTNVNSIFSE